MVYLYYTDIYDTKLLISFFDGIFQSKNMNYKSFLDLLNSYFT